MLRSKRGSLSTNSVTPLKRKFASGRRRAQACAGRFLLLVRYGLCARTLFPLSPSPDLWGGIIPGVTTTMRNRRSRCQRSWHPMQVWKFCLAHQKQWTPNTGAIPSIGIHTIMSGNAKWSFFCMIGI